MIFFCADGSWTDILEYVVFWGVAAVFFWRFRGTKLGFEENQAFEEKSWFEDFEDFIQDFLSQSANTLVY